MIKYLFNYEMQCIPFIQRYMFYIHLLINLSIFFFIFKHPLIVYNTQSAYN